MPSIGAAASQGLESGFNLGLRMQNMQQETEDRARRQALQDEDREYLRKERARKDQADEYETAMTAIQGNLDALKSEGEGLAQQYGGAVPPEVDQDYRARVGEVRGIRDSLLRKRWQPIIDQHQKSMREVLTQLQTDPDAVTKVAPADLYGALTTALRRDPRELLDTPDGKPSRVLQGVSTLMAGLQTQNQDQILQGANVLLEPELKVGVGQESPYGGTIVGKRIAAFVPHPQAPGQFTPMLRVYVSTGKPDTVAEVNNAERLHAQDPDAPPGATGYYMAPVTENRSTDRADNPKSISLDRAMEYAGQMQTLASVLSQHPELRTKVEQGAKAAGGQTGTFLQALYAVGGKMPAKQVDWKTVKPGERLVGLTPQGQQVGTIEGPPRAAPATGLGGQVAAVQAYADEAGVSFEEAAALFQRRGLLRAPAKGGSSGGGAGGPAGAGAAGLPASGAAASLTGEDYLKTLPADDARIVRGLADGSVKPSDISTKDNRRERLLAAAKQFRGEADLTGRSPEKVKPLPAKERQLLVDARSNATTMDSLLSGFKDDYASKGVLGFGAEKSLEAKGVLGWDKQSVQWWKNYRKMAELVERHAMFGASLTVGEQAAWRSADITPGMDADVIRNNLTVRAAVAKKVLEATQQDLVDSGYDEQRVRSIGGRDVRTDLGVVPPKGSGGATGSWGEGSAPQVRTATNPRTGEKLMLKDGKWVPMQ